jgi:uncharacterized protein YndB with AHSA1/START domain
MTDRSRGILEHRDGRHVLRFERVLRHPREKVWRALTDNAELTHWFPALILGERTPGAKLRFEFSKGGPPVDESMKTTLEQAQSGIAPDDPALSGQMLTVDPPRLLEYLWAEEHLRWELHAEGAYTRLVFIHTFDNLGMGARVAAGWDLSFDSLTHRVDGTPPGTLTLEAFDALYEEYAARYPAAASETPRPGK